MILSMNHQKHMLRPASTLWILKHQKTQSLKNCILKENVLSVYCMNVRVDCDLKEFEKQEKS